MNELLIILFTLLGALIRYQLSTRFKNDKITTLINLCSCFLLALVLKFDLGEYFLSFLAAFSTLSTYNFELLSKFKQKITQGLKYFVINVLGSLLLFIIVIVV